MHAQTFEKPVSVLIGLGFIRTVSTVMAAYEMVAEWPASPRSRTHLNALGACRGALNGECKAEEARSAFLRFAEQAGILMEDPSPIMGSEPQLSTSRVAGMN